MVFQKRHPFFCQVKNYFPISTLNIFIGANNSRKSRFLRLLASSEYNRVTEKPFEGIREVSQKLSKELSLISEEYKGSTTLFFDDNAQKQPENECFEGWLRDDLFEVDTKYFQELSSIFNVEHHAKVKVDEKVWNTLKRILQIMNGDLKGVGVSNYTELPERWKVINEVMEEYEYYIPKYYKRKDRTFIPILRGLRTHRDEQGSGVYTTDDKLGYFFKNTIKGNHTELFDVDVFTGESMYDELLSARNSEKSIRKKLKLFENFIADNFFPKSTVEIVARGLNEEKSNVEVSCPFA